jgi:hypothetical protein
MTLNHRALMLQCLLLKRTDIFSFDADLSFGICRSFVIQYHYHTIRVASPSLAKTRNDSICGYSQNMSCLSYL